MSLHGEARTASHGMPPHLAGHKRRLTREHPNGELLPLSDRNGWYYPSHAFESTEELDVGGTEGNWGHKNVKKSRWIRRGKMTAWGPEMEEWEAEDRARKRIKLMLSQSQERRSPSPPRLPHLRSPSPPLVSPYPPPVNQHMNLTSFVMDKSVTHTFRSSLLDELEQVTHDLVEGETVIRRALGRLWQVMNDDPDQKDHDGTVVPKREEEDDEADTDDEEGRRLARAPDLTPPAYKIFLSSLSNSTPTNGTGGPHSIENELPTLEKSLATLRELQDDGREYVERLQEIRDGLGDIRAQRDNIWEFVRELAVVEMADAAHMCNNANSGNY